LIGPIAGAGALRGKQAPLVFAVRASAQEELSRLLAYTHSIGLAQLAVAVQDDGFGQSYWSEFKALLQNSTIQVKSISLLNPKNPDYAVVVSELQRSNAQALVLLANSVHSVGILKAWREKSPLPFVFNLSGQANGMFASGLKGYAGAAAFITVTPDPWGEKTALQREYRAAMSAANLQQLSYLSFEAYINARVAIEAIKRSKTKTPAGIKSSLEKLRLQLGELDLRFDETSAARFTDYSMLRADGSFRH
jgi:ABC-type branched-subunit amino acid transport system substrate-binding protein